MECRLASVTNVAVREEWPRWQTNRLIVSKRQEEARGETGENDGHAVDEEGLSAEERPPRPAGGPETIPAEAKTELLTSSWCLETETVDSTPDTPEETEEKRTPPDHPMEKEKRLWPQPWDREQVKQRQLDKNSDL